MFSIYNYDSGDDKWKQPCPRGQQSAQMMVYKISEGEWITAFQANHHDKCDAPTVEGADFPNLGISQAWNYRDCGAAARPCCSGTA